MPEIKYTNQDTELFCHKEKEVETDKKDKKRYDTVLPIYPGSFVQYLIDHLLVRDGDVVLDLCTGSGILGIYASDRASKVIATDISKRALEFAKRNAKKNSIQNIEFRQCDLFESVGGERFDYIVTNPPFVPVPDNVNVALHSGGGSDGLHLVRRILEKIEIYLKPNGRMQLYSLTLGNKKETLLEDILRKNLSNRKVTMVSTYSKPLPLEIFVREFEKYSVENWKQELVKRGLTHLYSYIVNIEPSDRLRISKTTIPQHERKEFPDNWENWKGKFSYWVLENK